jgi:antirestriction protein ArdC
MTNAEAAEIIAAAFEEGIAPWSRSHRLGITCGLPVDAATGKPFRGVNAWLLELSALRKKYRNRSWATRGQWESLGGVVQGEGTPIIDDGIVGRTEEGRVLYNVEQVEVRRGAPVAALERFWVAPGTFPDYDLARRLLDASGARVVTADRCFCVLCSDPSRDYIAMTRLDPEWGDKDSWWSVLFHELTHWAAEGFDRVRWRGSYNHCELVAEIGATTLTNRCGIPKCGGLPTDTGMVEEWVSGIRASIGYLTLACAVAEVATSFVLDHSRRRVRA